MVAIFWLGRRPYFVCVQGGIVFVLIHHCRIMALSDADVLWDCYVHWTTVTQLRVPDQLAADKVCFPLMQFKDEGRRGAGAFRASALDSRPRKEQKWSKNLMENIGATVSLTGGGRELGWW